MNVQEYIKEDGSSPYQEWFNSLDALPAAKVTVAKSRLELGNTSNVKWFDGIGEYKIDCNTARLRRNSWWNQEESIRVLNTRIR